jgi:hypothetical protein
LLSAVATVPSKAISTRAIVDPLFLLTRSDSDPNLVDN